MAIMSALWFCKLTDAEIGPLTPSQLIELARNGELQPNHFVRRSDSEKWSAASRVKGLFTSATATQASVAVMAPHSSGPAEIESRTRQGPANKDADWLEERQDLIGIAKLKMEFSTVRWSALFPIGSWLGDRPWSLVWVHLHSAFR